MTYRQTAKLPFDKWVELHSQPIGRSVPGPASFLKAKYGIVAAEQMLLDEYQKYLHDDESGTLQEG